MMLHLLYPSALSGHCLFVVSGLESPVVKCRHSCDQEQLIDCPASLAAAPLPPGHCWDISDLSQNKSNKVRVGDSLRLIRLQPELMTEESGAYN